MRRTGWVLLAAVSLCVWACLAGCSSDDPKGDSPDKGRKKDATTQADRANPESVARAFLTAVRRGNLDEAAGYVHPEERERFRKSLDTDKPPPIPETPELKAKVSADGQRADVAVLNAKKIGLDMKLQDGKWWVTR